MILYVNKSILILNLVSVNLNNNFIGIESLRLPLDIALNVIVTHFDGEFNLVLNIYNTAVRVVLGVDFAVENLVGPESVSALKVNALHCVALHFAIYFPNILVTLF